MLATAAVIVAILLLITGAFYGWFLFGIYRGLRQLTGQSKSSQRPMISVIVAARNEESTIANCIDSISRQTYPSALFELLVVDDGSTDRTVQCARSATPAGLAFRLLPSFSDVSQGKTSALARGIELARGTIIVTTDADCTVPPTWLAAIASYFAPDVAFVAGPVVEFPNRGLFHALERLEFFGIITAGAGLIGDGRPVMCNGANMAFRKSAYDAVGGYGPGVSDNDDEALMNRIIAYGLGRVAFAAESQSLVQTHSNNTPWTFFLQRMRWASKQGRHHESGIMATLVVVYFFFAASLTTFFIGFWIPCLMTTSLALLIVKAVVEFRILTIFAKSTSVEFGLLSFCVAESLHVPYIVITAAAGQFLKTNWKE